jgi:hypothetical protein
MAKYLSHLDVDSGQVIAAAERVGYQWSQPQIVIASAAYTRPANTTAYTTLDAVSDSTSAPTALNFANVVRETGGHGIIRRVQMVDSVLGTLPTSFRLLLFSDSPTPTNDNAALSVADADLLDIVGEANLLASAALSVTAGAMYALETYIPFQAESDDRDLYGLVQVVGAYTPASAEVFTFEIAVEQA